MTAKPVSRKSICALAVCAVMELGLGRAAEPASPASSAEQIATGKTLFNTVGTAGGEGQSAVAPAVSATAP